MTPGPSQVLRRDGAEHPRGTGADPGQALDWQTLDEEFSQFAVAQLREAGTLVPGRATCELMAAVWQTPAGEQSGPGVAKAMNTTPRSSSRGRWRPGPARRSSATTPRRN
jgi:hypothetical protein